MTTNFHRQLMAYLRAKDKQSAMQVILSELGRILVTDRQDFIEMLKNGGIYVQDGSSDAELIEKFVENAHVNRKLLLGAALLLNHKHKVTNFDGGTEISDAGVKNVYKVFLSGFDGVDDKNVEEQSNFLPLLALAKPLAQKLGKKNEQKSGAGQAMAQAAMQQQLAAKAEAEKQKKKAEKKKNTLVIIGGVAVGLTIVGIVIYKIRKSRHS